MVKLINKIIYNWYLSDLIIQLKLLSSKSPMISIKKILLVFSISYIIRVSHVSLLFLPLPKSHSIWQIVCVCGGRVG